MILKVIVKSVNQKLKIRIADIGPAQALIINKKSKASR